MDLITERLVFKEITWDDLEDLHRLHSVPEVDQYNTLGIPGSLDDSREMMRPEIEARDKNPRTRYTCCVRLKNTREFIGAAGITLSNDKFRLGEIYYKLALIYWGQGLCNRGGKKPDPNRFRGISPP